MSRKQFPNKGDNSPLLLILGIIFLLGSIFSFFMENKKEKVLEEDHEDKQNSKDFI
jgi:hypothetical protein